MNNHLVYILPQENHFSQGDRGRVTHALGVIEGFLENGYKVSVITGSKFEDFETRFSEDNLSNLTYIRIDKGYFWSWRLLLVLYKFISEKKELLPLLIVRFKTSSILFLWLLAKICLKFNVTSIVEINSFSFNYKHSSLFRKVISWFVKKIEIITVGQFKYRYVISEALKEILSEYNLLKNTVVVPNGATSRKEDKKMEASTPSRLVYLGSLKFYYDIESIAKVILQSFLHLKVSFHIYGDGPEMNSLKRLCEKEDGVVLHGRYNNDDLDNLVKSPNDILIVPYKPGTIAEIGSPTKLFEYMSLKCPIIASSVGQSKYIIEHGETGFIYQSPDDVVEIIKLLSKDFFLRKDIAQNAYDDLLENHTWTQRMKSLIKAVEND
jgi:glycosyltransferase involved in cell wall biosynthesis